MVNETINRIGERLQEWKRQEAQCKELFSSPVLNGKAFLRGTLDFYDRVVKDYRNDRTLNQGEKMFLNIVKDERKKLAGVLMDNPLKRLSRAFALFSQRFERSPQKKEQPSYDNPIVLRSTIPDQIVKSKGFVQKAKNTSESKKEVEQLERPKNNQVKDLLPQSDVLSKGMKVVR